MRRAIAVGQTPCYGRSFETTAVRRSNRNVCAARHKFPFGFGRHTETFASETVQLLDESLAVIPTHAFHRKVIALEMAWVLAHHSLPKTLRDFILANLEILDVDSMRW